MWITPPFEEPWYIGEVLLRESDDWWTTVTPICATHDAAQRLLEEYIREQQRLPSGS